MAAMALERAVVMRIPSEGGKVLNGELESD
jgi:hypothetical protein